MTYEEMMKRILAHEGGFTRNPLDRGNWTTGKIGRGELKGTKFGISAMSYPKADIKNLTRADALAIYYADFYSCFMTAVQSSAARYQLLDYAVNSGVRRATKSLQKAVGVRPDGVLGPKTRAAALSTHDGDLVLLVLADRLEFMSSLSVWKTFGRGWAKRIALNLRYAAKDTE